MPKNVTYRLDEQTLEQIERLAGAWGVSKTDIIRQGVGTLVDLYRSAGVDALALLAVLRERYGADAQVIAWVSVGARGEPQAHVHVDGAEAPDLTAKAAVVGDVAHVFLEYHGGAVDLLLELGEETLLAHSRLPAGTLPYPPDPRSPKAVVIRLADVSADVPAEAVKV